MRSDLLFRGSMKYCLEANVYLGEYITYCTVFGSRTGLKQLRHYFSRILPLLLSSRGIHIILHLRSVLLKKTAIQLLKLGCYCKVNLHS
jgi:hypothetical protein